MQICGYGPKYWTRTLSVTLVPNRRYAGLIDVVSTMFCVSHFLGVPIIWQPVEGHRIGTYDIDVYGNYAAHIKAGKSSGGFIGQVFQHDNVWKNGNAPPDSEKYYDLIHQQMGWDYNRRGNDIIYRYTRQHGRSAGAPRP